MSFASRSFTRRAVACSVAALTAAMAQASFFDIVNDWSDVNNPMGQWSLYKNPTQLFGVNQADWFGDGSNLRAWADDPYPQHLHVPFWAKIDAAHANTHGLDAPADSIMMHGNDPGRTGTNYTALFFTAPTAGTAVVAGDTWMSAKTLPRGMNWRLLLNGNLLTEGFTSFNDNYTSASPLSFAAGTGGAGALTMQVAAGDLIELQMLPNYNSPNDGTPWIAGLHMSVDLTPVPEPSAMLALAAGSMALLRRRRV